MIALSHRVLVRAWVGSFFSLRQRIDLFHQALEPIFPLASDVRFSVTITLVLSVRLIGHPSGLRHLALAVFFFSRALASGVIHGGSCVNRFRQ